MTTIAPPPKSRPTPASFEEIARRFKAIAEPNRLRILGSLARAECAVDELAAKLGLTDPTISHHLRLLREAGLVAARPEGTTRWYRLVPEAIEGLAADLVDGTAFGSGGLGTTRDAYEQKVLDAFLPDGRLRSIPAQRKKRQIVLRRLVERFAPGRAYTEAEINAGLLEAHDDVATLRRELIMDKLLARDPAGTAYRRALA